MIPISKLSQADFIRIYENVYNQPYRIVFSTFGNISERRYQDIKKLPTPAKRSDYLKIIQAKLRKEEPIHTIYKDESLLDMTLNSAILMASESNLDFEQFKEFFPIYSATF